MSLGQIIQLAALGVQDLYLKIKPQYTMFRKSYKRHTNYATQVVRISESNGTATWGSKVDFDLTRNGDLIAETYLVVQLPCITGGHSVGGKWYPTAYKAVPGYVNPEKDHYSGQGDHLVAHTGKGLSAQSDTPRVKAVLGHAKINGSWKGHPSMNGVDSTTNGTGSTTQGGVLVGPSHSQVAYVDSLGHAIIKDLRFYIAQNVIQEFTGEYLHIHHLMNNPAESLNDALFSYGDDLHSQGPAGGSLADGVGFQASKYGHGAIASGGFWVDMTTTATDPGGIHSSVKSSVNNSVSRCNDAIKDHQAKDIASGKGFTKLTETAVSKIGRSMAFLPLASQTYVGMCFHNASAANAHIDYCDKGMDTRSAEAPYSGGFPIGQKGFEICSADAGPDGYTNFDPGSDAVTAEAFWTGGHSAFSSTLDKLKQTSGFFAVNRGLASRTQPRGIGLHEYAGYHGSLVRVEDSVGSGLHVSDKYIGLDEFNAAQTVCALTSSAQVMAVSETDLSGVKVYGADATDPTTAFDVSRGEAGLYFDHEKTESTRHTSTYSFENDHLTVYSENAKNPFVDSLRLGDAVQLMDSHNRFGPGAMTADGHDVHSVEKDSREQCFPSRKIRRKFFIAPIPHRATVDDNSNGRCLIAADYDVLQVHNSQLSDARMGHSTYNTAHDACRAQLGQAAKNARQELRGLRVGDRVSVQIKTLHVSNLHPVPLRTMIMEDGASFHIKDQAGPHKSKGILTLRTGRAAPYLDTYNPATRAKSTHDDTGTVYADQALEAVHYSTHGGTNLMTILDPDRFEGLGPDTYKYHETGTGNDDDDTRAGLIGTGTRVVHNGTTLYIAKIHEFGEDLTTPGINATTGVCSNGLSLDFSLEPMDPATGLFNNVFSFQNKATNATHFIAQLQGAVAYANTTTSFKNLKILNKMDPSGSLSTSGDPAYRQYAGVLLEIDFDPDSGHCNSNIKPDAGRYTADNKGKNDNGGFMNETTSGLIGHMAGGVGAERVPTRPPPILGYFAGAELGTESVTSKHVAGRTSIVKATSQQWYKHKVYLTSSRPMALALTGDTDALRISDLKTKGESGGWIHPANKYKLPSRSFIPCFALASSLPAGTYRYNHFVGVHRAMDALVRKPACGLSKVEFKTLMDGVLDNSQSVLESMVGELVRSEFHRGGKQSGSAYFDSESTAGCGPRVSLGALQYTCTAAQPLGSAPAMSQLAADIIIPQTSSAVVDAKKAGINFATRMMVALDRSSALSQIAGTTREATGIVLSDAQDKEVARLVKNYNPGPAYEIVSGRLDTSMYSKLRTHAQMNSGFGRRAQMSAVGNHQMEDGSGKCVQVCVPLPFWYSTGPACDGHRTQALPMIALQYHNVSISVNLRSFDECVQTDREHRVQPFRCTKMIGVLGEQALHDAGIAKVKAPSSKFAKMPNSSFGAREGSTLLDTLAEEGPSERAVCCVNMHNVRDTLQGLRYKSEFKDGKSLTDPAGTGGGYHLVDSATGKHTAPGYQGVTDERYHVDVGTWLNFSSASSSYANSAGAAVPRFNGRVGQFDGEFEGESDDVPKNMQKGAMSQGEKSTRNGHKYGSAVGNLDKWGQGQWNATLSTACLQAMEELKKVPLASVFGPGQLNGGYACHSQAMSTSNKFALTGMARPCAMSSAMGDTDVCGPFASNDGTMGWKVSNNAGTSPTQIIGAHLLVTYIFLDSAERRLFAANAHEYLITQCQKQSMSSAAGSIAPSGALHQINIDLKFNHPVSHLFWVLQRPESEFAREWFRYEATHGAGDPLMIAAHLSLNSSKREEDNYLNPMNTMVMEPWNYFKKCNNTGIGGALRSSSHDGTARNIHTYSFAQNPGEWYPTGSLNFSRIDRVELKLMCKSHAESHLTHPLVWGGGGYRELCTELYNANQSGTVQGINDTHMRDAAFGRLANGINVRIYARNFNVLRIQSGMGAIKYAN